MGLPTYVIPPKFLSEWPDILIRSGCRISERTLDDEKPAVIGNPRSRAIIAFLDIEYCSVVALLLMTNHASLRRSFSITARGGNRLSGDLRNCIIAQMMTAGAVHAGGPDVFRGAYLWAGVQLDASQAQEVLKSCDEKLAVRLICEWPSQTSAGDSLGAFTSFKCLRIRCGRSVVRTWSGLGVDQAPFFAFKIERRLFGTVIQRTLEDSLARALSKRGGRIVPKLRWGQTTV